MRVTHVNVCASVNVDESARARMLVRSRASFGPLIPPPGQFFEKVRSNEASRDPCTLRAHASRRSGRDLRARTRGDLARSRRSEGKFSLFRSREGERFALRRSTRRARVDPGCGVESFTRFCARYVLPSSVTAVNARATVQSSALCAPCVVTGNDNSRGARTRAEECKCGDYL